MPVTLPGTGTPVSTYTANATPDIGTAQVQVVHPCYDAAGTATLCSTANPLPVTVISGGDGSVQGVDVHDAPVTADPVTTGGYASAAAPTNVSADGDATRFWCLRNGAQCVNLTAAGVLIASGGGTEATALRVTIATDSTGALGVKGGVAHDGVGTGVAPTLMGAYASAAAPADVSTDGDATRVWCLRNGAQCVNLTAAGTLIASGNGTSAGALRVTLTTDGTGVVTCIGSAAHDASAAAVVPVLVGCEARTAVGTAVTSADAVRALADVFGKQVVVLGALYEESLGPTSVNFTNTTAADLIAAQGANIKIVVTSILVTNAHATVSTKVTVRDKTTTTKKFVGYAAAVGGGWALSNPRGLLISDANSAIEAVCGTTGSDVDVTISGFLIKN